MRGDFIILMRKCNYFKDVMQCGGGREEGRGFLMNLLRKCRNICIDGSNELTSLKSRVMTGGF